MKWLAVLLAALLIVGTVPMGTVPSRGAGLAEGDSAEPTPSPSPTPTVAPTPKPTEAPAATPEPTAVPVPDPTDAPKPEATDTPAPTLEPVETAVPEETPGESADPTATPVPKPETTQAPENTAGTEATPEPESTPEPEATEEPVLEDQSPDEVESKGKLVLLPKRSSSWRGTLPSDDRGMMIPIVYQFDYKAAVCTIDDVPRSVATSGCGAASVSMVIAYLTGNTEQTPYSLFYRAVQNGRYRGSGLDHQTLSWLLRENGVKSQWISNSADAIQQALEEGKPVIAHMGPGTFTQSGHYIVLRGVTEDGAILLNDPNSAARTGTAYSIETLLAEARGNAAFLVCWIDLPAETDEMETAEPETADPTRAPRPTFEIAVDIPLDA